jgi:hypothetical protein
MYSALIPDDQNCSFSVHILLAGDLEHFSLPLVDPQSFSQEHGQGADLELPWPVRKNLM